MSEPTRGTMRAEVIEKVAAACLVLAAAVLFAREIGNDFLWGHDGGNGAPFWSAARASLRFGVLGQAKDYTELTAPTAADLNTHHPLLLHFHLVAARWLIGPMEWAGRLVPFLYAIGTVLLLWRITRRAWWPSFALVAVALYVTTPLHLVFATMIDHEQGGIFWTLLACYGAMRALTLGRREDLVLVAVGATFALQFAWGSYFVLASAGAIALLHMLRSPRGRARDRARRLTVLLLVTGVANAAAFFLMIYVTKGSFADMRQAFAQRTTDSPDDGGTVFARALDLYGPLVIGATVAGLARLVARFRSGDFRTRDLVAASFFAGQVGLSFAFRNAGRLHSYWTFFAGVACALLSADALIAAFRWLRRRVRPGWAALAAVIVLGWQARFGLAQQEWGLQSGHAAYMPGMDDQFEKIQLAKWLHDRHGRDVAYELHSSVGARTEMFYYLDAPLTTVERLAAASERSCARRACVFVADLRGPLDGVSLSEIAARVSEHATALFGDHLVVIERTAPPEPPRAYRLEPRSVGPAYRWFVNGRHAPAKWAPAPGAAETFARLSSDVERPTFVAESTKDGIASGEPCPRGLDIVGVGMRRNEGAVVGLQAICAGAGREERTRWLGLSFDGEIADVRCADGGSVRRIGLAGATDLSALELDCGAGLRGPGYVLACPAGQRAISIHARRPASARARITGVGIGCVAP